MRTTTCAFEAAGISAIANRSPKTVFFIVNSFLQLFQGVRSVVSVPPVEELNGLPTK